MFRDSKGNNENEAGYLLAHGIYCYNNGDHQRAFRLLEACMTYSLKFHMHIYKFLLEKKEFGMINFLREKDVHAPSTKKAILDHNRNTGCSIPERIPLPFNTSSSFSFWNPLPKYNNRLASHLKLNTNSKLNILSRISCMIAVQFCDHFFPVGSGVLLINNKIITAKHCLENWIGFANVRIYAIFNFLKENTSCDFFEISALSGHPEEDIIALKPAVNLVPIQGCADVEFTNNLQGHYYLPHYADGSPLQISTGQVPDFSMNFQQLQFNLVAEAGSLASGAGVFDYQGKLVAINIARTIELGPVSRRLLLLSNVENFIKEKMQVSNTNNITFKNSHMLPPDPISEIEKTLFFEPSYSNTEEGMTQCGLAKRIKKYLLDLSELLGNNNSVKKQKVNKTKINKNKKSEPKSPPTFPPLHFVSPNHRIHKNFIIDKHQPVHTIQGPNDNKTIFAANIGRSVKDPKLRSLIFSVAKIAYFFCNENVIETEERNSLCSQYYKLPEEGYDLGLMHLPHYSNETPSVESLRKNGKQPPYLIRYSEDKVFCFGLTEEGKEQCIKLKKPDKGWPDIDFKNKKIHVSETKNSEVYNLIRSKKCHFKQNNFAVDLSDFKFNLVDPSSKQVINVAYVHGVPPFNDVHIYPLPDSELQSNKNIFVIDAMKVLDYILDKNNEQDKTYRYRN